MVTRAILVTDPRTAAQWTIFRETDARTGMARGLADYLSLMVSELLGRQIRFKKSLETWSEPEDLSDLPVAAVVDPDPGTYEESALAPTVAGPKPGMEIVSPHPTAYLVAATELSIDFQVEVLCSSPEERMAIAAMLEDAFMPFDWMFGFRLALPFYHGAHATFTPVAVHYTDNEVDAQQRMRRLIMRVNGRVPVLRVRDRMRKTQVIGGRLMGISVVVEIVEQTIPTGTSADEEASDDC